MCAIDWPDHWHMYNKCPECGESTDRITNGKPLSVVEAKRMKAWSDFEIYYEKYCAARESREIAYLESILAVPAATDGPRYGPQGAV